MHSHQYTYSPTPEEPENDYTQSQFDKKYLYAHEKPFSPLKEDINVQNVSYYSPSKKKSKFRLTQNLKTQQCKQILSQVQNLKVPKEILRNKDRFYREEYERFQQEVEFKEFKEFEEMLNNETIVTIEYYYEDRSKFHRELNETKEKFTSAALELADIIQRRFPFVDVIIKNLKQCDEIQEFHPYGLFEVQIVTNQGAKTGILYSKKISYIIPSPNKIIEEIYFFVDKVDLEIGLYDLLEQTQIVTPNGFANKKFYAKYLEGVEVILRQKVYDYQVNKEGEFLLYGLNKPTNKNEILSHTLGSSKTILYTRSHELDNSNINISGELSAHSKQNPVKTFMTKGVTNAQGIVKFKEIVIGVDNYEIEVNPVSFFNKEKVAISLLQLASESNLQLMVGLRPKNVSPVNINLFDDGLPLSGAIIRLSSSEIKGELDEELTATHESVNSWVHVIRESNETSGNYSLLAEPGIYYIQILAKGYTAGCHRINVQKGDNVFDFQMMKKVLARVSFTAVDLFTLRPVKGVEVVIYDHISQQLGSGTTDESGMFSAKVEMMTKLKICTRKENYIEIYQEFMANTLALTESIIIKMIPKDRNSQENFEVIASFPADLFNVTLQVICPDHTTVNEKTPYSQPFNIKFDELVTAGGKNSLNMITYKPESHSLKTWEFEIIVTLKSLLHQNSMKMMKSTASLHDVSFPHDQSSILHQSSMSSTKRSHPRLTASNLFLNNRVTPNILSPAHSLRGNNSSILQFNNENTTKVLKAQEDVKNLVDLNNCLRVYIIHKNVLQDVLYCCLKNLGNRIWRIGTFQVGQGVFTKINSPDMKDLSHSVGKEETVKLEQKKDAHKSTMKSQMSGNLRQKDIMTGSFAGKQRGNSAQSRK